MAKFRFQDLEIWKMSLEAFDYLSRRIKNFKQMLKID
jgi:hypothetical protein